MNIIIPKTLVSMVTFLYLMIHLWLWIVQPYKSGVNMSLFDSLTKPFNPDVNNDSNTMLDSLLFTASNNWNIDSSQIMENMNKEHIRPLIDC